MRLRPYKHCDAKKIAGWIEDEDVFFKWGGERFGRFPVSAEQIDDRFTNDNGDCAEEDNFYPWVAFTDEDGVVGSFIMRYLNGDNRMLRFGWVIVDSSLRGKGYGTQMIRKGLEYAFNILGVDFVSMGVFENNDIAHNCYKKAGFRDMRTVPHERSNIIEMLISKEEFLGGGK